MYAPSRMDSSEHPLRIYRVRTGRTLADLAEKVGATKATLSRIERGRQAPSMGLVEKLKAETGLCADDFCGRAS